MSDKTISFTVPLEAGILERTADYLSELAADMKSCTDNLLAPRPGVSDLIRQIAQAGDEPKEAQAPAKQEQPTPTEEGSFFGSAPLKPEGGLAVMMPEEPITLDINGLPWDERIHSSTAAKNQDGSWRLKRGVDRDLVAEVEAELRATMGSEPVPAPETPAVMGSEPAPAPASQPPVAAPAPTPPAAQTAPMPPTGPAVWPDDKSFPGIIRRITTQKVDQSAIAAACEEVGLKGLPELPTRPDLFDQFAAALNWE